MAILLFRPYRHWHNLQILDKIQAMCPYDRLGEAEMACLNHLFYEAKLRGLALEKQEMITKILSSRL